MTHERPGQSPFYPGQPVPVEFFVGRPNEIERLTRAASQVAAGRPRAVYIEGDYGVGKTSLARLVRSLAENDPRLFGIHAFLGTATTREDVAALTLQATLQTDISDKSTSENIRHMLAKYVGEKNLFGFTLRLDEIRAYAPNITHGFLPFLDSINRRLSESHRGLVLVFDEINSVARDPSFALFLKSFIDENAIRENPLPLLLIVCGTSERRLELIQGHQRIDRVFEVVRIGKLEPDQVEDFYSRSFGHLGISVDEDAMELMVRFSGGIPRIMQLIGDKAFWNSRGQDVAMNMAVAAIVNAAADLGRNFVDPHVYRALRSDSYKRILNHLSGLISAESFTRKSLLEGVGQSDRTNVDNFLNRMRRLEVIRSINGRGTYEFRDSLTRLYVALTANQQIGA